MVATNYAWDPEFDCILKETDAATGAINVRYTQEPRPYGGLVSQRRGSTTNYYHYDNVGTTRALTNQAQTTTDRKTYTAYGEQVDSSGTTVNPFAFVGGIGYHTSGSLSMIDVRERFYRPSASRWASRDKLEILAQRRPYTYCRNEPVSQNDPSGLQSKNTTATGPWVVVVSWIDDFDHLDDALIIRMLDELSRVTGRPYSEENYLRMLVALQLLRISQNTPPPASFPNHAAFVTFAKTFEYRGYIDVQYKLNCCTEKGEVTSRTLSKVYEDINQGYTPIRSITTYKSPLPAPLFYDTAAGKSTVKSTKINGDCVRRTIDSHLRVGDFGAFIARSLLKEGPPYAWVTVDYVLCCDGRYSVKVAASCFPSQNIYIDGTLSKKYAQKNLAQFTYAGDRKLGPGGPIAEF